uniref:SH2 domain containing 6 n=1 Tax=Equus caballus TaxID=9796 RepID=A0A9L0SW42_HORSE
MNTDHCNRGCVLPAPRHALAHLRAAVGYSRTAACWVSLGTRGTVTVMLLRVPCSDSKRTGPTPCAPAQGLMAPSPSPWQCFSTVGSSTFPSGSWMVGATMPWAGRARTTRSSSPLWPPLSSTTCSSPCPSWTDTAAAGSSPACSSPPSPDTTAEVHTHLWPHSLLLVPFTLGCLPGLHPSRPSLSLAPVPAGPDERHRERLPRNRKGLGDPTPCSPRAWQCHSLLHLQGWGAGVRQGPHSQPPGMAVSAHLLGPPKLLWMKSSSGKLSLRGTAQALLGHKENPLASSW